MRTGLSKKQKTTSVFFDEASPIIEVCTYNTSLKKRLSEYAAKYPVECRLVDDDEGSQRAGKEEYPEFAARQEVMTRRPWGECFPAGGFFCF